MLVAVVITTLLSYFTGYNKDVRAPLTAIQLPEAQQLINEFNGTVKTTEALSQERLSAGKELENAEKAVHGHGPSLEAIALHCCFVQVLDARIWCGVPPARAAKDLVTCRCNLRRLGGDTTSLERGVHR